MGPKNTQIRPARMVMTYVWLIYRVSPDVLTFSSSVTKLSSRLSRLRRPIGVTEPVLYIKNKHLLLIKDVYMASYFITVSDRDYHYHYYCVNCRVL